MDRVWVDEVVEHLGARYRTGPTAGDGVELLFRAGRAEFRPSHFVIGGGESGRELEVTIDVRVPKGSNRAEANELVRTFEERSAKPRGFSRFDDTVMEVQSERGADSGSVRTLRYRHAPVAPADAAKEIRAIVESIDIPITVGIHEPEHVIARNPAPPRTRPPRSSEPLERWEYRLEGGLLGSLTVIVDPNDRTLTVVKRRFLSKQVLGDTLRLVHVAKLAIRRRDGAADLVAVRRDGNEVVLASGSGSSAFVGTAERLAKKVLIPIEGA